MSIPITNYFNKEERKMNEIEEMARRLRNEKAKKWRDNNKDKVKEINKRYWINKAKKELENFENLFLSVFIS